MPRLAIIISAVGSIESLEGTLVSVLENRPHDCEILVVLNQAYSDPYDLKNEVKFIDPQPRHGWSARVNAALANTRAPFVHLLASGCEVTEGWADAAISRFGDRLLASLAPLVLEAARPERVFAAGVGYRMSGKRLLLDRGKAVGDSLSRELLVGPASFAGFYRKAALDFVGGFSTQLGPQTADVDLALVLRHAGFTATIEPDSRVLAATIDARQGDTFRQGLEEERLFWRNLPNNARAAALARHAASVALSTVANMARPWRMTELVARTVALSQFSAHARHRRALAELNRRAVKPKATSEHVRIDRSHPAPTRPEASPAARWQSR